MKAAARGFSAQSEGSFVVHFYAASLRVLKRKFDGSVVEFRKRAQRVTSISVWVVMVFCSSGWVSGIHWRLGTVLFMNTHRSRFNIVRIINSHAMVIQTRLCLSRLLLLKPLFVLHDLNNRLKYIIFSRTMSMLEQNVKKSKNI